MDMRPIKTELDYKNALRHIEELMRAEPDTDAGTELEILAKLVGAYEDKHFPIAAPDPVDSERG